MDARVAGHSRQSELHSVQFVRGLLSLGVGAVQEVSVIIYFHGKRLTGNDSQETNHRKHRMTEIMSLKQMRRAESLVTGRLHAMRTPQAPENPRPLIVHDIHDGDTLTATIALGFGIQLVKVNIRAWGYDAWEITKTRRTVKVTPEEIRKGAFARDALKLLWSNAGLWAEETGIRDPYGRVSCKLWSKWVNSKAVGKEKNEDEQTSSEWLSVADWMKSMGHVRTGPVATMVMSIREEGTA